MDTHRMSTFSAPGSTDPHGHEPDPGTPGTPGGLPSSPGSPTKEAPPLRSIHTSTLPGILRELGISVLVTTYQAGKLVMLRPDGDRLNTHFRGFSRPMGLAVDKDRRAIGPRVAL